MGKKNFETIKAYGFNLLPIFVEGPAGAIMNKNKDKSDKNYKLNKDWTNIEINKGNIDTDKFYPKNKAYVIRTGKISNITGVDIDNIDEYPDCDMEQLCNDSDTLTISTPNGGKHYIYQYNDNLKSTTGLNQHIDIRNDGACLFGAGTKTNNGYYKIINEIEPKIMSDEIYNKLLNYYNDKIPQGPDSPTSTSTTTTTTINNKVISENELQEFVKTIDVKYSDNYDDWTTIGWCIANISRNNNYFDNGYNIFLEFSKNSNKFDETKCYDLYYKSKDSGGVGYTTLKKYNPEFDNNNLYKLIDKAISSEGTHFDISTVLHFMFKNNVVFDSYTELWYCINDFNIWKQYKNPIFFTNMCGVSLYTIFWDRGCYWTNQAMVEVQSENSETFKTRAERGLKISQQCKDNRFVEQIIKTSKTFFDKPMFLQDFLDSNSDIFSFTNGKCYDFKLRQLRNIEPNDYVLTTTGYNYPSSFDETVINEIKQIIDDIFPILDVRTYFLKSIALDMHGSNYKQEFRMLTGSGSNGKSLLYLLISKVFGGFFSIINPTTFTKAQTKANEPTELYDCKGVRLIQANEPEEDCINQRLQVGKIKEITGERYFKARGLFKNPLKIKIQFTPNLLCNDKPSLSKSDNGTVRRIRIIEFIMKYLYSNDVNYDVNNPHHRIRDDSLVQKFDENIIYRDALLYILLDIWNKDNLLDDKNIIVPQQVIDASADYIDNSNDVKNWLLDTYDIVTTNLPNKDEWVKAQTLYDNFIKKTKNTMSSTAFASRIKDIGLRYTGDGTIPKHRLGKFYVNIKEKDDDIDSD